ncbi:MAG TPA: TetR/AcrR family transcriptional regulator [Blastocatellia bacterium]|nr:TetR/AcrR family transcriptional regulator [Blastocatellia bacterium]
MPKVSKLHLDARRRQILNAAIDCFAADGIHKTTMRDIIRKSGLSMGAIYQYFKSKEEIIATIAAERHRKEIGMIASATKTKDAIDSIRRVVRGFFDLLNEPGELNRRRAGVQFWAESLRNPSILALARAGIDEPRRKLVNILRMAQRQGRIPRNLQPDSLARVMIAAFQGFILQKAWDDSLDQSAFLITVETMLDGLVHLARTERQPSGP